MANVEVQFLRVHVKISELIEELTDAYILAGHDGECRIYNKQGDLLDILKVVIIFNEEHKCFLIEVD